MRAPKRRLWGRLLAAESHKSAQIIAPRQCSGFVGLVRLLIDAIMRLSFKKQTGSGPAQHSMRLWPKS